MNTIRSSSVLLALAICAGATFSQDAANEVFPRTLADRIHGEMVKIQAAASFPGMTVGVVLPDGRARGFAVGLADREKRQAMKSTDRMLQGSVGKTYVAAVALQLVGEGKLDLKKNVSDYLADLAWFSRIPNAGDITVRHIMTHTSGVMRYEFKPAFTEDLKKQPNKAWQPAELLRYILDEKPSFAAGKGWEYSDSNYILLGMIIEKITGKSLFGEIKRRLLVPLGLRDTVPSDRRRIPGLIQGYPNPRSPFGLGGTSLVDGVFMFNPQFEWAGGGWASTTLDLARWAKALYEGRAFPKHLLSKALDGEDARLGRGSKYGLGVIMRPTPLGEAWGHSGYFPGYLTEMHYYSEHRFSVAVQFNTSNGRSIGRNPRGVADGLARLIADHLRGADRGKEAVGRIAFMKEGGLFVIDADGRNERQVVADLGYERPVTWSPDGRHILYWKHSAVGWDVWRVDLDGKNATNLTHTTSGGCRMPRYSPTGTKIAFMRDSPNGLFVMNADGSAMRRLSSFGHRDNPPSWSPDGRRLCHSGFVRTGEGRSKGRTWLVDVDGGSVKELPVALDTFGEGTFSPTGGLLAIRGRAAQGPADIYVVEPDGTDLVNLTRSAKENEYDPRWAPDGKRIAYIASMDRQSRLRVIDVASKAVVTLPTEGRIYDYSWAPDSARMTVVTRKGDQPSRVFVLDTRDGSARALATGSVCAWQPVR